VRKPVIIIAEAGVNHNGDMDLALQLIRAAAAAGCDYVKFQSFKTENLVSREARKAEYQRLQGEDDFQYGMLKKLELSPENHVFLIDACRKAHISFLSSAFDSESLELLMQQGLDIIKIPSGEITNLPFLRHAGGYNKKVLLSTGMSTMEEAAAAVDVLVRSGTDKQNITVLHCNTAYPTPVKDVNLLAMNKMREELNLDVGYSDHTKGTEVSVAAVALGASVIEKHFTVDRNLPGPDHKASLEPEELKMMVQAIRNVELALGQPYKSATASELANISIARKSIHLAESLSAGHILSDRDLVMKRPGDGLSPMMAESIAGKKIKRDLPAGHKLAIEDFE
jgi:N,N'-diacetyllegionaminate synthase